MPYIRFSVKLLICSLFTLLIVQLFYSCKKSDKVTTPPPAISYKQKVISIAEDVAMTPVKPDSTGGSITEYNINPLLPKGLSINKANGEISGTPSDTLAAIKFVVTAKGPGGTANDTITLLIGTVAFNYGPTGVFSIEKNAGDLAVTPIAPVVLAGNFTQYFITPITDTFNFRTGLKFNTQTGQINGTPTKLTSTNEVPTPYTLVVTGISGNKIATTTVAIYINDKKPVFSYAPYAGTFSTGTSVGTLASAVFTPTVASSSGAIVKYRLAPNSPALPGGLTLDSTTGKIIGAPTAAANVTLIVRGLNTGGYMDVNVPMVITTSPQTPQVYYLMSTNSTSMVDTICPRLYSGNTIYLTKTDNVDKISVYLYPVITAGQISSYTISPIFESGATKENLSFGSLGAGIISGLPGQFATTNTPSHTITLTNPATSGTNGSFAMNIVANAPFFTYNADNGNTKFFPNNIYGFVLNQRVDVASGTYLGYSAAGLAPVGGTGVISYSIQPVITNGNIVTPAFSATGLTFNTATGTISGTPTVSTFSLSNYNYWEYVITGKKSDGSFTIYKIRVKIYNTTAEWGN
jgi:hypothetical protein